MNDDIGNLDVFQVASVAFARLNALGERPQGTIADLPDIPWRPRGKNNADLFLERLDQHCNYIADCARDLSEKFGLFNRLSERLKQIEREKDAPAGEVLRSTEKSDAAFETLIALDDEANRVRQLQGALEQAIFLRFSNLKLAFCPQESSSARHLSLELRFEILNDAGKRAATTASEKATQGLAALDAQAQIEKKAWDKIRKRRGFYLRTIFEGYIPQIFVAFMEDAERRNSIAHADERIDHGTYQPSVWRWEQNREPVDAIILALMQFSDAARGMGFAIHKYRALLCRQRGEL